MVFVSTIGNILKAVSYMALAPVPLTGLDPVMHRTIGVAVVIGAAEGILMVSTFSRVFDAAMRRGFDNNISTYMLVSGWYHSIALFVATSM